jgi:ribose transport system substrate-binding protein
MDLSRVSRETRRLLCGCAAVMMVITACGSSPTPSSGPTTIKIGYLSGGNADPFVFTVTLGIRAAAAGAGVSLFECDGNFDDATAVKCANTMHGIGLQAVINWQFTGSLSPAVCTAYGNLPTVSLDTQQKPCSKVFVGTSNEASGEVAGQGLGTYMSANMSCQYDLYVSIENRDLPDVFDARAGGTRKGFETVCGAVPSDKYLVLNKVQGGSNRALNIRTIFTDYLTTHPSAHRILVSTPGGDADGETAIAAAKAVGRGNDVFVVASGADTSSCSQIRNNPQWVGDVAYFPEQYAGLAVPAAIALAKGQSVAAALYLKNVFITKANIDQYYPACF